MLHTRARTVPFHLHFTQEVIVHFNPHCELVEARLCRSCSAHIGDSCAWI
jgi:hypothetical protein